MGGPGRETSPKGPGEGGQGAVGAAGARPQPRTKSSLRGGSAGVMREGTRSEGGSGTVTGQVRTDPRRARMAERLLPSSGERRGARSDPCSPARPPAPLPPRPGPPPPPRARGAGGTRFRSGGGGAVRPGGTGQGPGELRALCLGRRARVGRPGAVLGAPSHAGRVMGPRGARPVPVRAPLCGCAPLSPAEVAPRGPRCPPALFPGLLSRSTGGGGGKPWPHAGLGFTGMGRCTSTPALPNQPASQYGVSPQRRHRDSAVRAGGASILEQAERSTKERQICVLGMCIQLYSIPTAPDPLTYNDGETQEGDRRHIIPSTCHSCLQNHPRCATAFHLSHQGQGHGCRKPIQEFSGCRQSIQEFSSCRPQPGQGDKARLLSAKTCSISWSPRRCQGPAQRIHQELPWNLEAAT